MDWKYLLTSFEGRISRQPFWLVFWCSSLPVGHYDRGRYCVRLFDDGRNGSNMDPEAAAAAAMSGMTPIIIISLLFLIRRSLSIPSAGMTAASPAGGR